MKKVLLSMLMGITAITASAQQKITVWQNGQKTEIENVDSITFSATTPSKPEHRDFTVNGVTFRTIYVKGGTYYRGAQDTNPSAPGYVTDSLHYDHEYGTDSEAPVYHVNITDFYMAETECTQKLWKALFPTYSYFENVGDNMPVNGQMYSEMNKFITALNKYLHDDGQLSADENFTIPTESQWEWAARGGVKSKGYRYAGSNNIDDVAWYKDNSDMKLHEVKLKAPNELGLYDMSGNALEATSDNFSKNYSWASDYQTNPTGSTSESPYGLTRRGGGYAHQAFRCTVSKRDFYDNSAETNEGASGDMSFRLILK